MGYLDLIVVYEELTYCVKLQSLDMLVHTRYDVLG
jgi:hypothetical protein